MEKQLEFAGQVILITGSGNGIGEATAVKFAELGAQVVIVDLDEDGARLSSDKCLNASPLRLKPLVVVGNLSLKADMDRVVEATIKSFGRIDVLVNNAATGGRVKLSSPNIIEEFDRIFAVNAKAPLYLCHLFAPFLKKTKGNIVNVGSILATNPADEMLIYSMAKSAINMMTRCLAQELGPQGIRVNIVNPGHTVTGVYERLGWNLEEKAAILATARETLPLRRVNIPEDVAESILFLASSKRAPTITGAALVVDAGCTCASLQSAPSDSEKPSH